MTFDNIYNALATLTTPINNTYYWNGLYLKKLMYFLVEYSVECHCDEVQSQTAS